MDRIDIVGRLEHWAAEAPQLPLFIELLDGREESARLTASDLHRRAAALGASLTADGFEPGGVCLLISAEPVEFMVGFFGLMHAGLVPAPVPFPRRPEHVATHLRPVAEDAAAVAVVAGGAINRSGQAVLDELADALPVRLTDVAADGEPAPRQPPTEVAYLQYTSGSTSRPKGVVVPHEVVLPYIDAWSAITGLDGSSTLVNWLPLTHDLGLACSALPAVAHGITSVLLTPASFARRPVRWAQAITTYRGTHAWGPNFSYDLLVDRVSDEELADIDLSSMVTFINGAEPVRERTRVRFLERFASTGLRPGAYCAGWGMAESTCGITAGRSDQPMLTAWFDAVALESGKVVRVADGAEGSRSLCGNGVLAADHDLRIVDPDSMEEVADDVVGEIWVRGPSVCAGYYRNPQATEETFGAHLATGEGPFLRTGDLGFVLDDEVFICSRLKHLIVIRGRNLYPHDIELAVELASDAIRPGCTAAFHHEMPEGEVLVVVSEVVEDADQEAVTRAIRTAIVDEFEVVPEVLLVGAWTVPKTTSGKLQREAARALWLERRG